MFRSAALFAAVAALAVATGAAAQTASAPSEPAAAGPMATAPAPAPVPVYTDQQMRAFANATLDLQSLGSQDAGAMTHAIEAAGMSVEQYNAMGDAMRADPALAARLDPYLQSARIERPVGSAYNSDVGVSSRSRRVASSHSAAHGHHRTHGRTAAGHHGKTTTSRHRGTSHTARHGSTRTHRAARPSHRRPHHR